MWKHIFPFFPQKTADKVCQEGAHQARAADLFIRLVGQMN